MRPPRPEPVSCVQSTASSVAARKARGLMAGRLVIPPAFWDFAANGRSGKAALVGIFCEWEADRGLEAARSVGIFSFPTSRYPSTSPTRMEPPGFGQSGEI